MTWDGDRVRIELCDVMSVSFGSDPQMAGRQAAEIRLSDDAGNILRARKPAVRLVGGSRPELLRQLADWIEANDDPALSKMAAAYWAMREPG
jgi:hypothetical protein